MSTTSAISPPEIPLNTSTDDFDFDHITQRQERLDQVTAALKVELPRLYTRLDTLEFRAKYPEKRFVYYNKKTKKDVFAQVFTGIFPNEPPYTTMIHAIATANINDGAHIWYCPNSMNSGVYALGTRPWTKNIFGYAKHSTDQDCLRRVKFPIDIDPMTAKRVDPITGEKLEGSTSEEQARALMMGQEVIDFLLSYGFPAPHWVSSGNGSQLLYDVSFSDQDDLKDAKPEDAENVLKRVYDILRYVFQDRGVTFDMGPLRPGMGLRMPGTFNNKAPGTPELPKRLAETIYAPEELAYVPLETFRALVDGFPHAPRLGHEKKTSGQKRPRNGASASRYSSVGRDGEKGVERSIAIIEAFCLDNEMNYIIDNTSQGTFYRLDRCLYQEEREGVNHTTNSNHAFIQLFPEGRIGAGCQRPDCDEYVKSQPLSGWELLKRIVDPEYAQQKEREEAKQEHQSEVLTQLENAYKQITNGVMHQAQPPVEHDQADPEDVGSVESPPKKSILEQAKAIVDEVITSQDPGHMFTLETYALFSMLSNMESITLINQVKKACRYFNKRDFSTCVKDAKEVYNKTKVRKQGELETFDDVKTGKGEVLPVILLDDREYPDILDDIADEMMKRDFYKRKDTLCRIVPYWEQEEEKEKTNKPIQNYDTKKAKAYVVETMAFKQPNTKGELKRAKPDDDLLYALIHDERRRFPRLQGVVNTPIVTDQGRIILQPGYDKETGWYYLPKNDAYTTPEFYEVLQSPVSADQARKALEDVFRYFEEFPFADEASRANFLGLLLTSVARSAIRGQVPLHLIDANRRGSGKSLLASCVSCIMLNAKGGTHGLDQSGERLKSEITSILAAGMPLAIFDNVVKKIFTPELTRLLTSDTWIDRLLGGNEIVALPQRTLWIATGNNLQVGEENARRCVLIQLKTPHEYPEDQEHSIEDLEETLLQDRPRILQNLLLVIKGYFDVPKAQRQKGPRFASFSEWSRVIGGMLLYAGQQGFRVNHALLEERDSDIDEWARYLKWWLETFGEKIPLKKQVEYVYGGELSKYTRTPGHQDAHFFLPGFIHEEMSKKGIENADRVSTLAYKLRAQVDTNHGGYVLHNERPTHKGDETLWWVTKVARGL